MIVVVGGPDERLDVARAWGADHVVSVDRVPDADQRVEAVQDLTGGGPEVLVEMSGVPGAFAEGLEMAAVGARYAVVGTLGGAPTPVKPQLITTKGLTLLGQLSGATDSYYKALAFLRAQRHRFDWDLLFTNRYTLDSVSECMENIKGVPRDQALDLSMGRGRLDRLITAWREMTTSPGRTHNGHH